MCLGATCHLPLSQMLSCRVQPAKGTQQLRARGGFLEEVTLELLLSERENSPCEYVRACLDSVELRIGKLPLAKRTVCAKALWQEAAGPTCKTENVQRNWWSESNGEQSGE